MRTPSPRLERDRHAVQSRIQTLLLGQRPRHPVLSRVSTGRLILEGIVEELRIYRLHRERQVMREREGDGGREGVGGRRDKTHRRNREDGEGGKKRERSGRERIGDGGQGTLPASGRGEIDEASRGEVPRRRKRRSDKNHGDSHGSGVVDDIPRPHYSAGSPAPDMSSVPTPLPASTPPRPARKSPATSIQSSNRTPSSPNAVHSSKHQTHRYGENPIKGNHGRKDTGPGPFPKWKPKLGPLLELGSHLKDRYDWGVENHHYEQRNKERRKNVDATREAKSKGRDVNIKAGKEKNSKRERGAGREEEERGKGGWEKPLEGMSMEERRMRYGRMSERSYDEVTEERTSDTRNAHIRRKKERASHRENRADRGQVPDHATQRDGKRSEGSPGDESRDRGTHHGPNVRDGRNHQSNRSAQPRTGSDRHEPIPIYEATSHSQRVEERERAEALQSKGMYVISEMIPTRVLVI